MSSNEGFVSDRVIAALTNPNPMRDTFIASGNAIFNPETEILSIGVAQNDLMQQELKEKVREKLSNTFADLILFEN